MNDKINVLYIDPNNLMSEILIQSAKPGGYNIITVQDSEQALQIFSQIPREEKTIVVIGTYKVSRMNCYELVLELQKIQDVPIIVWTSLSGVQDISESLIQSGVTRVVDKSASAGVRTLFQVIDELSRSIN